MVLRSIFVTAMIAILPAAALAGERVDFFDAKGSVGDIKPLLGSPPPGPKSGGRGVRPCRGDTVEMAQRAEALGYDSMVVTDHIVIPRRIESRYPYNATGRLQFPAEAPFHEPLSLLSFLAGVTRRIRFGPSVLVLPYRNPVLTAKMLATMDVLSKGRLLVGVGVGWLAEEFAAMGSPPFEARGAVSDEWI